MYASNFDASSFISHQYIIAGQAESAVNSIRTARGVAPVGSPDDTISMVGPQRQIPNGYEVVCWDPNDARRRYLDTAKVSWAYYAASDNGYKMQDPWALERPIRRSNTFTII